MNPNTRTEPSPPHTDGLTTSPPHTEVTEVAEMSEIMKVPALGRPFILGMLYDARRDEPIPGITLWDSKTLQENTSESPCHSSKFGIPASETIKSKFSLLDISGSLRASFLSGLIEVGGSAKYLHEDKTFQSQSRVTCQYNATTHFKVLSMTPLKIMDAQQRNVIEKNLATHVVTGILYGANAFFVFDSEELDTSSTQDIRGSMEAVIKKIPEFSCEGQVDKLTAREKALTDKLACKFYGDFILRSNPATFVDAVKTYVELPKLLVEKQEHSVPLKVWLMPLTWLIPDAPKMLVSGISDGLVRTAQDALEDLKEAVMRCNDSLADRVLQNFPQVQKQLIAFKDLCDSYAHHFKQTLANTFPLIREGKAEESTLVQLFDESSKSQFSHEKLSQWLDHNEREINVIRSCVDTMGEIKIVRSQSELDREVLAPGADHVLCFMFTSLKGAVPSLDAMTNFLDPVQKLRDSYEEPWYYSGEVITKMREKAKFVRDLSKELKNHSRFRFFVGAISNEKHKGATIYYYRDGNLVSDDFSKPDIGLVESLTNKSDLIWYTCNPTLDPNTVNGYLTLSEGNKKATYGDWQSYPDKPERFDKLPQVLCTEGLTGRHYWEVEWSTGSGGSVYVIAGYKGVARKGSGNQAELGFNKISWAFGKRTNESIFRAWHDKQVSEPPLPPEGCDRVGVYLDFPGGTLSFYRVCGDALTHLHTFKEKFTDPVYPGLWALGANNYAYICPFE